MRLYKYRGFSNLEFALDIFINKRLYAAHFEKLNDPMEGRFIYSPEDINRIEIDQIIGEKSQFGIVSLSKTAINHLLWSYYSESHTGFVVGIEVNEHSRYKAKPINYVDNFDLSDVQRNQAERILLRKHNIWKHEQEYRILKSGLPNFVDIEIKELIFGVKSNKESRKVRLIKSIAEKFCPDIEIRTLEQSEIDKGIYG